MKWRIKGAADTFTRPRSRFDRLQPPRRSDLRNRSGRRRDHDPLDPRPLQSINHPVERRPAADIDQRLRAQVLALGDRIDARPGACQDDC
jgi:hypothetical protein